MTPEMAKSGGSGVKNGKRVWFTNEKDRESGYRQNSPSKPDQNDQGTQQNLLQMDIREQELMRQKVQTDLVYFLGKAIDDT